MEHEATRGADIPEWHSKAPPGSLRRGETTLPSRMQEAVVNRDHRCQSQGRSELNESERGEQEDVKRHTLARGTIAKNETASTLRRKSKELKCGECEGRK